jgi:tRNA U34 5-methylaminomethyl-2-thiouridine-forming methyltransferase MnmC
MKIERVITGDGSDTLFSPEIREHYHSTFGAIQESRHVFIEAGFIPKCKASGVDLLEIGFGTGLNAFLTMIEAERLAIPVRYTAIEPFPLEKEIFQQMNYPGQTGEGKYRSGFLSLHNAPAGKWVPITVNFSLKKITCKVQDVIFDPGSFDVVYFDAFSPEVQPEMWTPEIFTRLFSSMRHGSVLTTYCAKGTVRRGLTGSGFTVEKLPGPPGKREITRATKTLIDHP